jgi:integrase
MTPRNVADAVEAPRPAQKAPELLTEAQALSFLESVKGEPLYPLWLTLFSTGMRKAEVAGLRWSDVDLPAGIIHVSQTAMAVHKKGTVISEPKTEQSRRSIGLPPQLVEALKLHKERTAHYQDFEMFKDQDLVFSTKRGTPFGSRNILTYFHRVLNKAGLPKVSLHSLRHLHATMLLKAGLHPKIVQSRLGHSQIGMTMDLYSHVLPGMDEKATAEMTKVLGTATTA